MKFLLFSLLSCFIFPFDGGTRTPPSSPMPSRRNSNKIEKRISQEDLEKAVVELTQEMKKKKKNCCCTLHRAHIGVISSAISSSLTAAITIATMYSRCSTFEQQPPQ